jgi:hypothetical protein
VEPSELPYVERWVLKKSSGAMFLSYLARRFSFGSELRGHATLLELSCTGRWVLEPTGHVLAPELL